MNSSMILWECTYKVNRSNDYFYVKDWVFSTTKPGDKTIGHYWRHLFNYVITDQISYLAPDNVNIDNAIIQNIPFDRIGE